MTVRKHHTNIQMVSHIYHWYTIKFIIVISTWNLVLFVPKLGIHCKSLCFDAVRLAKEWNCLIWPCDNIEHTIWFYRIESWRLTISFIFCNLYLQWARVAILGMQVLLRSMIILNPKKTAFETNFWNQNMLLNEADKAVLPITNAVSHIKR